MACYCRKEDVEGTDLGHGQKSYSLLGEKEGCVNGCCAGISIYSAQEYTPPAVHDDQEGFLVLSGTGWAKIGNEEFRAEKDMVFIAPAGTKHQMKSDSSDAPLTLFWFHAAV